MQIPEKYYVDPNRPFHGKYWPQGVPYQLEYDYSLTLGEMLRNSVEKWPNSPAIWFAGSWISYNQLWNYVQKFGTALYNLGVRKGDVVAIHLPNCPQYSIAYYAVVSLGAIVTGVNPSFKSAEFRDQIHTTKAQYLIVLDILYDAVVKPIINEFDFKKIIHTNVADLAGLSPIKRKLAKVLKKVPSAQVNHPRGLKFLTCLKTPPNLPSIAIDAQTDTAILMLTGGTTGVPKAAELTHQNCVANAIQAVYSLTYLEELKKRGLKLGPKTGVLVVIPLYHAFAMTCNMNAPFFMGGFMVLYPKPPASQELLKTLCSLPNYNGYFYIGVELLFQRIAELPEETIAEFDLKDRLLLCISGAGPLHEYVREPFERKTGAIIREGYGLTEAAPVISCNNFFGESNPGTVGTPFPGTDWQIFPTEDFNKGPIDQIGENGTGEICVCGPQVMKGYFEQELETKDTLKEWEGRLWLRTGDIGYLDAFGRIVIRDRKKQLIKVAGHSVFPKEVENLLGHHPDIIEVAVAGIPDRKSGEAVKAWVAITPDKYGTLTADEILMWAKENMASWKCPKYIEFVQNIPKSAIGKVLRRTLQENDPAWKLEPNS